MRKNTMVGLSGFLAGLGMFVIIYLGIHVTGMAPFNISPSAAFLYNLGVENSFYALLLHFCYAIFWSYVLVYAFEEEISMSKTVLMSLVLWVFMMLVYSPLIGWGVFGFGYAGQLPPAHPLYLEGSIGYVGFTLFAHLVYGGILGLLSTRWTLSTGR